MGVMLGFMSFCCNTSPPFLMGNVTQCEHERPVPMVTENEALADHHDN